MVVHGKVVSACSTLDVSLDNIVLLTLFFVSNYVYLYLGRAVSLFLCLFWSVMREVASIN